MLQSGPGNDRLAWRQSLHSAALALHELATCFESGNCGREAGPDEGGAAPRAFASLISALFEARKRDSHALDQVGDTDLFEAMEASEDAPTREKALALLLGRNPTPQTVATILDSAELFRSDQARFLGQIRSAAILDLTTRERFLRLVELSLRHDDLSPPEREALTRMLRERELARHGI